ncbi:hypothetical protein BH09SUM1_BH09SUM1_30670 [soil metagenome]
MKTDLIKNAIMDIVAKVPRSAEHESTDPMKRAKAIVSSAAARACAISAALALPPGPLGMLTILPDLIAIWKIQSQMVADIAATFGRTTTLTREQMIYCLFRHAAGQAVRDLVVRAGERAIVRRTTARGMETVMERVGVKLTQRAAGEAASRWLPIIGAAAVGAYAMYDTKRVGAAAIELFRQEIVLVEAESITVTPK